MSGDDNLFSRWSNRKRAVAEEEAKPEATPAPLEDDVEAPQTEAPPEAQDESEEETLARFGLPAPESLGPGDDFSGFMQSGVPEVLRRRALRRLWRSNPVLACVDGLNDYDEDFTSPEENMKVLKTAYKVGRGFLRDPEEEVAEELPDDAQPASETLADVAHVDGAGEDEAADQPGSEETLAASEKSALAESSAAETDGEPVENRDPVEKRPRRMRFQS